MDLLCSFLCHNYIPFIYPFFCLMFKFFLILCYSNSLQGTFLCVWASGQFVPRCSEEGGQEWKCWLVEDCSFLTRSCGWGSPPRSAGVPTHQQCVRMSPFSHPWEFLVMPEILLLTIPWGQNILQFVPISFTHFSARVFVFIFWYNHFLIYWSFVICMCYKC